ncbi:helix-turn-helix transcriptional regulator [Streptomyces sp. MJM8645]|uniref:helix-turn-helix domain-containing protein n=1 Tax=Streptomycetaceae TaxID=2062 RepID=UPI000AC58371|nr:helix-turn-helix transcriptional regulator [Streptomyces sp. MJM8645]WSK05663.1 helix-turn-helix domain-containing protein [Kitasatospora sp. NBC_01300]
MVYQHEQLVAAAQAAGDHTDSDIADRLKVARVTAWRLRTGKTAPSASTLARIELAYGLTAADLLGGEAA